MLIGPREFDFSRHTYVMGILNVTPDSFFDGGLYEDPGRSLERALRMEEEGADLIDIGAESTRPGAQSISLEEEQRRLFPALRKIAGRIRIPISIDTRRAVTAEIALKEGASLINDVSAFRFDFRMPEVVAQAEAACILMHMRGEPETMQQDVRYLNVVSEIIHDLRGQMELAVRMGVERGRILVDPGIGFGKDLGHNLEILRKLPDMKALEAPIVVGASRKTFIRKILSCDDPQGRSVQSGSLAVAAIAVWNGAALIRAHDVRETVEVIRMVEALKSPLKYSS
jgi:dihydropteroate synthase